VSENKAREKILDKIQNIEEPDGADEVFENQVSAKIDEALFFFTTFFNVYKNFSPSQLIGRVEEILDKESNWAGFDSTVHFTKELEVCQFLLACYGYCTYNSKCLTCAKLVKCKPKHRRVIYCKGAEKRKVEAV